jgi:hypothetical protein
MLLRFPNTPPAFDDQDIVKLNELKGQQVKVYSDQYRSAIFAVGTIAYFQLVDDEPWVDVVLNDVRYLGQHIDHAIVAMAYLNTAAGFVHPEFYLEAV